MATQSPAESTRTYVVNLFDNIVKQGLHKALLPALADDLVWTATNTSPLAGRYEGKRAYVEDVLGALSDKLDSTPAQMRVEKLLVDSEGEWATVIFRSDGMKGKNGEDYSITYCWVMKIAPQVDGIDEGRVKEVVGFYDGVKMCRVFGTSL